MLNLLQTLVRSKFSQLNLISFNSNGLQRPEVVESIACCFRVLSFGWTECVRQVQQSQVTSVLSEPQRALLSTITAGHQLITTIEKELITKAEIPELGSDPVRNSLPFINT